MREADAHSERRSGSGPVPLPHSIQVEPTTRCNLRCRMCPKRTMPEGLVDSDMDMPIERFAHYMEPLWPNLETITIQGIGEPLLNPDFLDMIGLAGSHECGVRFFTNATTLDKHTSDLICDGPTTELTVSVDAASDELSRDIRGVSTSKIMPALLDLARKWNRSKSRRKLRLAFVAMRDNLPELPAVVQLAAEIGAGTVVLQPVTNAPGEEEPDALGHEELTALLDESFRTAERLDVSLVAPETKRNLKCTWPWDNAYITVTGKVTPCCYRAVPYSANVLGDLNVDRFDVVWNSAAYESLRTGIAQGSFDAECRRFGCRYQNTSVPSQLGRLLEQAGRK